MSLSFAVRLGEDDMEGEASHKLDSLKVSLPVIPPSGCDMLMFDLFQDEIMGHLHPHKREEVYDYSVRFIT